MVVIKAVLVLAIRVALVVLLVILTIRAALGCPHLLNLVFNNLVFNNLMDSNLVVNNLVVNNLVVNNLVVIPMVSPVVTHLAAVRLPVLVIWKLATLLQSLVRSLMKTIM